MSKLQDLIATLCPNGVEYKKLGTLCKVLRGKRLTKEKLSDANSYPVFHGGIEPLGFYDCYNRDENTVMIINVGASAGTVGFSDRKFWSSDGCFCLSESSVINSKFLYYYLASHEYQFVSKVRYAGIPTLDAKVITDFEFPVPPMEVQEEIVGILDRFAEYTAELQAKLQAELQGRKEQYEYYRNELLSFRSTDNTAVSVGDKVEWKTMGEIGTFIRGNGLQKKDFTESGVGCIHYGQIYTHYGTFADKTITCVSEQTAAKSKIAEHGDLIIAITSENMEDVCKAVAWLGSDNIAVSAHATIFKHHENPKYLAYYLQTRDFASQKIKYARGAKVIEISPDQLAKITIPIPPIEEQERIVGILDKFEALVNDLTQGLPAEIEARREQYEYYRNKLLTFKVLA
jgi:type I restriction enzyme S subunit